MKTLKNLKKRESQLSKQSLLRLKKRKQESHPEGQTNEGVKFDEDKPRMDLLSGTALAEIARVMGHGVDKYGAHNWRKGLQWSRVFAAVQRHLWAWNNGETNDPETGINHLAHAGCGIMFLLEYSKTHADLDDRYEVTDEKSNDEATSSVPDGCRTCTCHENSGSKQGTAFGYGCESYSE